MDKMLRLAVADYAHSLLHDGESAPDFRWMNQYISAAEQRYKVVLSPKDRGWVEAKLRGSKEKYE